MRSAVSTALARRDEWTPLQTAPGWLSNSATRLPAWTAWRLPKAVRTRPESSDADSSYWPCLIKIKCLLGAPEGFNRERLLPRLSSSLWSQLQSHWGQGTAGWKSWASIARSATAVKRRWTAGARSSALDFVVVGRTAQAPRGSAARRARRCIIARAEFPSRSRSGYGAFFVRALRLVWRALAVSRAQRRRSDVWQRRLVKCVKNCARRLKMGRSEPS